MIRVTREPPKCKSCGKVLKWLPWKNGKPQRPIDPKTNQPCECWKRKGSGGDEYGGKTGRLFDKKDKYKPCPYCGGHYHIEDGNEDHEQIYHKDKKVHAGEYVMGLQCFADEILYHGSRDHWFFAYPDKNGDFLSVDGIENVREFAKTHNVKVIMEEYLLE